MKDFIVVQGRGVLEQNVATCADRYIEHIEMNRVTELKMAVEATFSSVIKCLKKDGRGLEKHIHNLNRNLESCRDTLKSLKSEHSSLRINKNKLESKIKNLEKIVNQKDLKISNLRTCL